MIVAAGGASVSGSSAAGHPRPRISFTAVSASAELAVGDRLVSRFGRWVRPAAGCRPADPGREWSCHWSRWAGPDACDGWSAGRRRRWAGTSCSFCCAGAVAGARGGGRRGGDRGRPARQRRPCARSGFCVLVELDGRRLSVPAKGDPAGGAPQRTPKTQEGPRSGLRLVNPAGVLRAVQRPIRPDHRAESPA